MTHGYKYLALLLGLMVTGCAAANKDQLINDGKTLMDKQQIADLFAQGPLRLESADFDGTVTFTADGKLQAKNLNKAVDTGKWELADGNMVCLKFSSWYYGDKKCYQIIENDPGEYVFFTANGARYYTAHVQKDVKEDESDTVKSENQDESGDKSSSEPQASPSANSASNAETDINSSFSQVAQNCPGCNLGGINLSNSNLASANLAGTDLSGTNLSGASLRGAHLEKANLSHANLSKANLTGANLAGANLDSADLRGANLSRADLTDANMKNAVTNGAVLQNTKGLRASK